MWTRRLPLLENLLLLEEMVDVVEDNGSKFLEGKLHSSKTPEYKNATSFESLSFEIVVLNLPNAAIQFLTSYSPLTIKLVCYTLLL